MSPALVVVAGYMLRMPLAGNVLAYFQHVLGLRRLGHRVIYIEESGWPQSSYDPTTGEYGDHPGRGLTVGRALVNKYCPETPVVFVDREHGTVDGATAAQVRDWLRGCDLLLNIGAVCNLPEFELCRRRAMIDMDPLFTQAGRFGFSLLREYHVRFTYGVNIGRPDCSLPTLGLDWMPSVPPVVLDLWELGTAPPGAPMTTVASWTAYGAVAYEGREYGQKDTEFLRLLELPAQVGRPLELALTGASPDIRERFRASGWRVREAADVSREIEDYRDYIAASAGELSPAKHAYVATRSGWFSDRSATYLAAGRPVVVQDTGLRSWLALGSGVHTFCNVDEAADAIHRVDADPEGEAEAAREISAAYFDSDVVLSRLLDAATATPASTARPTAEQA